MSNPISELAASARESHRDPAGRFGTQPAAEASLEVLTTDNGARDLESTRTFLVEAGIDGDSVTVDGEDHLTITPRGGGPISIEIRVEDTDGGPWYTAETVAVSEPDYYGNRDDEHSEIASTADLSDLTRKVIDEAAWLDDDGYGASGSFSVFHEEEKGEPGPSLDLADISPGRDVGTWDPPPF